MDARSSALTAITSTEVRNEFGKDLPGLQGKNKQAFFKLKLAEPIIVSDYDKFVRATLSKKFQQILFNHEDINTALREAEDEANTQIQAQLQK